MKLFFVLFLLSFNAFSQSTAPKNSEKEEVTPTGIELDRQSKPKKDVFEYGYSYISFGQGVMNSGDIKGKSSQLSVGYVRFAEEILYGITYNRYKITDKLIADGFSASIGFSTTKVIKIKPSIAFDFGPASVQNKVSAIKSSGLYSGVNLGIQLSESLPFHFLTGIKFGNYSVPNQPSVTVQSIYFSLGFEL